MDLTTITVAVMLALGPLGVDTAMHTGTVSVEVAIAPKIEGVSIDERTLAAEFEDQFDAITATSSVVRPLEIRSREAQGVGLALAEAFSAQNVAYAVQRQLGFTSDSIRFTLFVDKGALRGLVHGHSHLVGNINQIMIPNDGEPLIALVQRSALWGASQLAPYSTALYLLQKHSADKDFTDVVALVEHAKALLPPTPTSFDRSLFDNLLGLVALFQNDPQSARKSFDAAMFADLTNPVPFLNAAFTGYPAERLSKGGRSHAGADPSRPAGEQGAARHRLHDLGGGADGPARRPGRRPSAGEINRDQPGKLLCFRTLGRGEGARRRSSRRPPAPS